MSINKTLLQFFIKRKVQQLKNIRHKKFKTAPNTLPLNRNLNNPIRLILKDSVGLVDLVEAEGMGD